ncbi:MAG: Txe/YoeB family addiction module toxin [Rhodospirillaceae bacterium]|nr:Txe/YoeB family addiction module toxin [Rhodospirillaceae bacterium]
MNVLWHPEAWRDYLRWGDIDRATASKINELIKDIQRSPFRGIGKPEPLKAEYAGWWSRRITGEHRLIYRIVGRAGEQCVEITACNYHYR